MILAPWLTLAAACAAPAAQAPAQLPATAAHASTAVAARVARHAPERAAAAAPDIALLEYLGDYADAGVGLDPMGLDESGLALAPQEKREEQ